MTAGQITEAQRSGVEIIDIYTPKQPQYALFGVIFEQVCDYVLKNADKLRIVYMANNYIVVEDK